MATIFERTRDKREADAGMKDKPQKEAPKQSKEKTMSQSEFSGYDRPKQSKKWIEK